MPKVIENVREQLLKEARNQVAKNGYRKTTVRSVAGACNIAVGTVYNYFKSKDMLIASFMADDWIQCIDNIKSRPSPDAETALHNIYDGLLSFSKKHEALLATATQLRYMPPFFLKDTRCFAPSLPKSFNRYVYLLRLKIKHFLQNTWPSPFSGGQWREKAFQISSISCGNY